jgi:hypothetical protein
VTLALVAVALVTLALVTLALVTLALVAEKQSLATQFSLFATVAGFFAQPTVTAHTPTKTSEKKKVWKVWILQQRTQPQ